MSDSGRSERFRLQLHLATVIVVVILSGILLGLNLNVSKTPYKPRKLDSERATEVPVALADFLNPGMLDIASHYNENHYGWPLRFGTSNYTYDGPAEIKKKIDDEFGKGKEIIKVTVSDNEVNYSFAMNMDDGSTFTSGGTFTLINDTPIDKRALIIDILVCLAALVAVAITSEWLIRQREGRRP